MNFMMFHRRLFAQQPCCLFYYLLHTSICSNLVFTFVGKVGAVTIICCLFLDHFVVLVIPCDTTTA